MRLRPRLMSSLSALAGLLLPGAGRCPRPPPLRPTSSRPAEKKAGWRLLFDGQTTDRLARLQEDGLPHRPLGGEGRRPRPHPDRRRRLARRRRHRHRGHASPTSTCASTGGSRPAATAASSTSSPRSARARSPTSTRSSTTPDTRTRKVGPHRQAAAFYDVLPPAADKPLRPVGEWNESRVLVRGNHVEHWLNGTQGARVRARLARSSRRPSPRASSRTWPGSARRSPATSCCRTTATRSPSATSRSSTAARSRSRRHVRRA